MHLTTISSIAFAEDGSLTGTLVIPDSVINLGSDATFLNTNYSEIKIGIGVSEIPGRCFYNISNLKNVYFSSIITKLLTFKSKLPVKICNMKLSTISCIIFKTIS